MEKGNGLADVLFKWCVNLQSIGAIPPVLYSLLNYPLMPLVTRNQDAPAS